MRLREEYFSMKALWKILHLLISVKKKQTVILRKSMKMITVAIFVQTNK